MNKVVLVGRLTKDPELKFLAGTGTAVVRITVAIDRKLKKDGRQEADFIPVIIWGKQAENTATYVVKGKLVSISGRIQTRSYNDKDGTKRYATEVVAEEIQFLEWANVQAAKEFSKSPDPDVIPVEGDIPF